MGGAQEVSGPVWMGTRLPTMPVPYMNTSSSSRRSTTHRVMALALRSPCKLLTILSTSTETFSDCAVENT